MHPGLRDRLRAIDVIDTPGGAHTVLPSSSVVLGFQRAGRVRVGEALLAPAGVTGILPAARTFVDEGHTISILVRFAPQGAAALGAPVSLLSGQSVALDALLPPERARELHERVATAPTLEEAAARIEGFVEALPFEPDPLIDHAIRLLEASDGEDAQVAAVARAVGLGERQLERRFLARVGVTPKRFASLRRFERVSALARRAPTLTDAALEAGYYDQSHFIREFRRFVGVSPGKFFRAAR